jgi:plasmid stabilization system protein ParE
MTWPIIWTPPAELALDGIIDHIAAENPALPATSWRRSVSMRNIWASFRASEGRDG